MRERLEFQTHRTAVMLTAAWPMLLAVLLLMGATALLLPFQAALLIGAMMLWWF